jgi:hypothetical protein
MTLRTSSVSKRSSATMLAIEWQYLIAGFQYATAVTTRLSAALPSCSLKAACSGNVLIGEKGKSKKEKKSVNKRITYKQKSKSKKINKHCKFI